jgi:hypothetical protein
VKAQLMKQVAYEAVIAGPSVVVEMRKDYSSGLFPDCLPERLKADPSNYLNNWDLIIQALL